MFASYTRLSYIAHCRLLESVLSVYLQRRENHRPHRRGLMWGRSRGQRAVQTSNPHDPRTLSWFEGKLSSSPHSRDTTKGTTTWTEGRQTITEGSHEETHDKSTRDWAGVSLTAWLMFQPWTAVSLCLRTAVIVPPLQVEEQSQPSRAETQEESSPRSTLHIHTKTKGEREKERNKENPGEPEPWDREALTLSN